MSDESKNTSLQARVARAAEAALADNGSVGPLELLQYIGFLQPVHFESWRKGHECFRILEEHFQVGPEKFTKTIRYFQDWIKARNLRPVEASYTRRAATGIEELRITRQNDPEQEKFYRTHFVPANLPEKKAARVAAKLNRAPELVVFQKVSEEGNCNDCGGELVQGDCLFMEKGHPLCLACADLDYLVFLPAGDTALTRRARKHSTLAAVVVRFNRPRKRYERQGLLVTAEAIAQAEAECSADALERAAARARAAAARVEEDRDFIAALAQAIARRYPGCPTDETQNIAQHTGLRSSGRVGRSAAGRSLDPAAVDLAVIAHIRHTHTNYDKLLMSGADRQDARALVRDRIDQVLAAWRE
jgi:hypothetical protein